MTTHVRVVVNASSNTNNETSLNDHLLTGPKFQTDISTDILTVILRWRQCHYVLSADIEKMYRQILIDRDVDFQRILWISDETNAIQDFQLCIYGTASTPFLALRVIRQLIQDESNLAAPILRENIYVMMSFLELMISQNSFKFVSRFANFCNVVNLNYENGQAIF